MKKTKKASTKSKSKRTAVQNGDKLICDQCGLTVLVEECGDSGEDCGVTCCDEPMTVCAEEEQEEI